MHKSIEKAGKVQRNTQQVAASESYITTADPERLAALMPTAGANADTPLIPLTDMTPPEKATPLKVPPLTASQPTDPRSPIPTLPTANSQLPLTAPPNSPAPVNIQPLLSGTKPSQMPATSPTDTVPPSAIRKWEGPNVAQAPQSAPLIGSFPTPPIDISEPKQELSAESKNIINKLSAQKERKQKISENPITVNRAKDHKDLDKTTNVVEDTASRESLGMKIGVKTPKMNLDYELEKAYNALIAGRSDAAVIIYKNLLENDPNNKNALFGLATTYHRAGQLEMARPLYAKLLSIDPNNRDGLNNFLVLLGDEAPEDALSQMQRLKEANPDFSAVPAQMAVLYQKLNMSDQASNNMLQAIELAPENLTYRYNFAIMLDRQHKYDEAAQLYRQVIQAYQRGEVTPGNIQKIQQRLTFISSNRP